MFRIRKADADLYLASVIDSSGMEVYWTSLENSDGWSNEQDALTFLHRTLERYPNTRCVLWLDNDAPTYVGPWLPLSLSILFWGTLFLILYLGAKL